MPSLGVSGFARRGLVLALALGGAAALPAPQAHASPPGAKDTTAVLFEWTYASVARECKETLGPAGYGHVQVSPPQEHVPGPQWWTSYQPVGYRVAGRLGDRAAFAGMVTACHGAGVKVVVDTVINHMAAKPGTGTGGTSYTKYSYPGLYQDGDFHTCRKDVTDYTSRSEVQNCELVGLADLDTGSDRVRSAVAGYLNDLLSLGVDGFRIDAAKHVAAGDLAAIKAKLGKPDVYWKQETIQGAGEAVQPEEYLGNGDAQEFRYAWDLKRVFQRERLAYLRDYGEGWGYLPGGRASVFVDNHDTERDGVTLTYKDGAAYTLAHVFMLAWPYGSPDVHSGYAFTDRDAGPPNGGAVNACWQDGWKCQHKWPEVNAMVGFRNAVADTEVTNWWDNGYQAIAFGRGTKGYVVINHETFAVGRTFQTSLPGGDYCDVQSGRRVTVGADGRFTASVAPNTALALHAGARTCG
ncbi:glycosidase [Streptomyces cinnamoneus]|uniref:Alpha-amylase n=1 Tax=Streptomyces cinnamoneus TaxID=53446 RepID=A0A2G1XGH1_STRCJ|nr:alpha-amylase family protein [Streptomyces cinnamoneus]PHQ50301.1 glycosidase [Streptomyces cinnamoneus]PPT12912.1 glycosidase [Streptomyces cinnamoneus]